MQFKLAAFTTLFAAATLATASVTPAKRWGGSDAPENQCNTGHFLCCNSVQPATNSLPTTLLGLLGIAVEGITAAVGITCSPITVIGASGTSCSDQPTCCTDNSFNGVIALGCSPVSGNV